MIFDNILSLSLWKNILFNLKIFLLFKYFLLFSYGIQIHLAPQDIWICKHLPGPRHLRTSINVFDRQVGKYLNGYSPRQQRYVISCFPVAECIWIAFGIAFFQTLFIEINGKLVVFINPVLTTIKKKHVKQQVIFEKQPSKREKCRIFIQ